MRPTLPALMLCLAAAPLAAQLSTADPHTHADSLRGATDSPARLWWDVTYYDLKVRLQPADSSITGSNAITFRALRPGRVLQVDLMTPLEVDSVVSGRRKLPFRRDGNAFFLTLPQRLPAGRQATVTVHYHGQPRVAVNPPWQGGFSWKSDSLGRPWIVTTDQGLGASVWWPNKDTQADEPDSQQVEITVPDSLIDVSNGRLQNLGSTVSVAKSSDGGGTRITSRGPNTWEWFVKNPINNYAIAVAAGHYTHYTEKFNGEKGTLTLDFYPLDYN